MLISIGVYVIHVCMCQIADYMKISFLLVYHLDGNIRNYNDVLCKGNKDLFICVQLIYEILSRSFSCFYRQLIRSYRSRWLIRLNFNWMIGDRGNAHQSILKHGKSWEFRTAPWQRRAKLTIGFGRESSEIMERAACYRSLGKSSSTGRILVSTIFVVSRTLSIND